MEERNSLGHRLLWTRLHQGLTLGQLSRRSGLAYSYISQLQAGARINPTCRTLQNLAEALGVSLAFLLGELPEQSARWATFSHQLRQYWDELPAEERQRYQFGTTQDRFCLVVGFLAEQQISPVEVAFHISMRVGVMTEVLESVCEVEFVFLERLARFTGIPLHFLTHGQMEPPVPPNGEAWRYAESVRLALDLGVTPERLVAAIRTHATKLRDGEAGQASPSNCPRGL